MTTTTTTTTARPTPGTMPGVVVFVVARTRYGTARLRAWAGPWATMPAHPDHGHPVGAVVPHSGAGAVGAAAKTATPGTMPGVGRWWWVASRVAQCA